MLLLQVLVLWTHITRTEGTSQHTKFYSSNYSPHFRIGFGFDRPQYVGVRKK
jgi:hypothetical protein